MAATVLIEFQSATDVAEPSKRFGRAFARLRAELSIHHCARIDASWLASQATKPIAVQSIATSICRPGWWMVTWTDSLARPSGNVTGVSMVLTEMATKGLGNSR